MTLLIFFSLVVATPYTKPVLQPCIECNKPFYTYIPGTHCCLDDGGIMCHEEPMLKCPNCEYSGLGFAMNPQLMNRRMETSPKLDTPPAND